MRSAAPVPHINSSVRRGQQAVSAKMPRIAAGTCAPDAGPAATVCDGGWSAASAGRSCYGERPGARASVAVTLTGSACVNWALPKATSGTHRERRGTHGQPQLIMSRIERSIYNTRSTAKEISPRSPAACFRPSGTPAASRGRYGRRAGTTEGAGAPRRGCRARSWSGGGRRQAPARCRRGSARTAGWSGPGPRPIHRHRRGCVMRWLCGRGRGRRRWCRRTCREWCGRWRARPCRTRRWRQASR